MIALLPPLHPLTTGRVSGRLGFMTVLVRTFSRIALPPTHGQRGPARFHDSCAVGGRKQENRLNFLVSAVHAAAGEAAPPSA